MDEDFIHIAINNLLLIKDLSTESLNKKDFKLDLDSKVELNELIDFLVKNDFIETETDNDVYYLTPETYVLIELDELYISISSKLDFEDEDEEIEEEYRKLSEEELIKLNITIVKQKRNEKITKIIVVLLVLLMFIWFSYNFRPSNKEDSFQPNIKLEKELYEKMEKDLIHKSDSLKKSTDTL